MAQGIANTVVPFFGGMPATGTIARTVTNIRSGAASPVAGMVHAGTLAAVVLLAAPLAAHIPLAVLAGVLLFVAWNMGEWREFGRLKQFSNHYRLMMVSTFLVTIVFDLTVAVELGLVLAVVLFVRRQSEIFRAEPIARNEQQITFPAVRLAVLWRGGQDRPHRGRSGALAHRRERHARRHPPDLARHHRAGRAGAVAQGGGQNAVATWACWA
jgi:MFS superfamily sulfate permease-like transporter